MSDVSKRDTNYLINSRVAKEYDEQVAFVTWLQRKCLPYYAVPNGGKRSAPEAMRLKKSGVQSGVPDLVIPIANKKYHHLYIEMKRKTSGLLSENQKYWLQELNKLGSLAVSCKGAEAAIKVVEDYLKDM